MNNEKFIYNQKHFELHFQPEHSVHYQTENGTWSRATWSEHSLYRGAKRIQYNTKDFKKYIIIDIDNENLFAYKDLELPEPNFILKNRFKRGGHLFYVLDRTITHDYFSDIWHKVQKEFSSIAGGDEQNKGFIGKNINNSKDFEYIEIEPIAYDIMDLFQYCKDLPTQTQNAPKTPLKVQKRFAQTTGRNVEIFNSLRVFAYQAVKKSVNDNDFRLIVASQGHKINNSYNVPLKDSELNDITKSIIKYCLKNKKSIRTQNKSDRRGKMNLDKNMDLKEKQKLASEYATERKVAKNKMKIKIALLEMKKQGMKINISSVANYTKMNRITVRKYKELLQ